jgi:small subunit ribosomal protein S4
VNGVVTNIPSYSLKPGDVVEVRARSMHLDIVRESVNTKGKTYSWVELDEANFKGIFMQYPDRDQIPENIEEHLIVELYSK